jgi:hypothetical protein
LHWLGYCWPAEFPFGGVPRFGKGTNGWIDFRAVYYGTRCLLHHHNPYKVSEFPTGGTECPLEPGYAIDRLPVYVNMPTTCIFIAPLAMLPWGPAHLLWMILTAGVIILAAFLMWNLGARYSAKVSLLLICLLLANCEVLFGGWQYSRNCHWPLRGGRLVFP